MRGLRRLEVIAARRALDNVRDRGHYEPMERIATLHEVDWIAAATVELVPALEGQAHQAIVANCLPPIFPAYAKIFHTISEDLSIHDRRLTWDEWVNRRFADSVENPAHRYELIYAEADAQAQLRRVSWATLAERYGLLYTPTLNSYSFRRRLRDGLWPRYLFGPAEGCLDGRTRDALAEVLAGHVNGDCFFHFWVLAAERWESDLLYRGPIREVSHFPDKVDEVRLTPTHWFPPDRRWLICTDYDMCFTLVGGTEGLISDLLRSDSLECIRVHPDTRVDDKGDLPNLAATQER